VVDGDRLLTDRERHIEDLRAALKQIFSWRRTLRETLAVIVKFCAFATLAELAKVVTPPRRGSDTELVSAAQAIRDKVTPHRQALLDAGLPAQVFDDLPLQIAGLSAARDARDAARRNFAAAGKDLEAVLAAGDEGIEVMLNILKATRRRIRTPSRSWRWRSGWARA